MPSFWVVNVDLKGSSDVETSDPKKAKLYRALENLFRFFVTTEGVSDEMILWSGEGGFTLVDADRFEASVAVKIAEWFALHTDDFINTDYLQIERESLGFPEFRVCVGQVQASAPPEGGRVSNYAGWALSVLLKYERDFGIPGHISIWENVYKQLDKRVRNKFVQRPDDVHGNRVYDAKFPRSNLALATQTLRAKDEISRRTVNWLMLETEALDARAGDRLQIAMENVFTPAEWFPEIAEHIRAVLIAAFPGTDFRVGYGRPHDGGLRIEFPSAPGSGDFRYPIPIDERYAAGRAFITRMPVAVANVQEEIKKPETERRFTKTHVDQDVKRLASVLCLPVVSTCLGAAGEEKNVATYGVVCIDTPTVGFFKPNSCDALATMLSPLVTEFAFAESLSNLLAKSAQMRDDVALRPLTPRASAKRRSNRNAEEEDRHDR